ncbi:MAG: PAS domain S-box protein [Candidatus Riflebacteria bacterium]|nr:PAS domain S-box protein [Candidatus Riflebacteria bacterium]
MTKQIDLGIIGEIVSAISIIHVFPSEESIGEFVVSRLKNIPGCTNAGICFREKILPTGDIAGDKCSECALYRMSLSNQEEYSCLLGKKEDITVYPLETISLIYGYIILKITDNDKFMKYEPFIKNLVNSTALLIENRRQEKMLKEYNSSLEEGVEKRTRELHESEEQHKLILQTAMDGFWLCDGTGRLLEVNETYCRLSGYSMDELLTKKISDIDVIESPADTEIHIQKLIKRGDDRFETKHRRKDGSIFDVEISVQYRPYDGGRCVVFIRDISELKRSQIENAKLESQLLHSQKMELVGRLAGGIAHDFNNMLGVILGNAELAMLEGNLSPELLEKLNEISSTATRSADLTKKLLAFARKQAIAPQILNLNDTVSEMLKMLKRLISENTELVWQQGENLWLINMDPGQVDQILVNLVVNAQDAISGPGKIIIQVCNSTIDDYLCSTKVGFTPGEYVKLTVSDTGCGMNEETLAHIFEPFFTTKPKGKGTGLGLATVYGIIKQNNGVVNVYSEPGHGTSFNIFLPRHQGNFAIQKKEMAREPMIPCYETILLVEDELGLLNITSTILESHGYNILSAYSPEEAIRIAKEYTGNIHLLVTDIIMPGMNGLELSKQLISIVPQLKCLFMSGYSNETIAPNGAMNEGHFFLQKPFTLKELTTTLRKILDKRP